MEGDKWPIFQRRTFNCLWNLRVSAKVQTLLARDQVMDTFRKIKEEQEKGRYCGLSLKYFFGVASLTSDEFTGNCIS